jgi:hypothetical protein
LRLRNDANLDRRGIVGQSRRPEGKRKGDRPCAEPATKNVNPCSDFE